MEAVLIHRMIGHTIKRVDYNIEKENSILFKLKKGPDIMMNIPKVTKENMNKIITKNREPYDLFKLQNIEIIDIDWYSSFRDVDGLIIIDRSRDVYRIQCRKKDGIPKNSLYNYTKYKLQKDKVTKGLFKPKNPQYQYV